MESVDSSGPREHFPYATLASALLKTDNYPVYGLVSHEISMISRRPRILLVEDEEADVVHFHRLSRKQKLDAEIIVARDGDAALEILRSNAGRGERMLVITDLNMPGLTGHELIDEIRSDKSLAGHIVFILSTSDLNDDIDKAYRRNVAGYIVKDPHGEHLEAGIAMLDSYLKAVSL